MKRKERDVTPSPIHIYQRKLSGTSEAINIQILGTPDDPIFVADEVRRCMNVSESSMHHRLKAWNEPKYAFKMKLPNPTARGPQRKNHVKWVLTEAGLGKFVFSSRNNVASIFADWIFNDVIPIARRAHAGDLELVKTVLDRADTINDTTTVTTSTVIPNTIKDRTEVYSKHVHLARHHVDEISNDKGDDDKRMLSTTISENGTYNSTWITSTIDIDKIWAEINLEQFDGKDDERSIYFVRMKGTDLLKCGFATNVHTRLSALQVGSGIELRLEYSFLTTEYRAFEDKIHDYLTKDWVRGEWFSLPPPVNYIDILRKCDIIDSL